MKDMPVMSVENRQMSASQTTRTITSTVSQFAEQLQLHAAVELMPSAIKSKTMLKDDMQRFFTKLMQK